MIAWLARLFRRTPITPPPPPPRDEAASRQARAAIEQMDATTQRIDAVLRERQRQEDLRRIRRTGNFVEGWLVPDRPEETP